MKLNEKKDCLSHHNAILFKVNSVCDDFCSFCSEFKNIKLKKSPLNLKDFKNNYYYLKKRYKIDYIILTGGEPTLHKDFFNILDFLREKGIGYRFITNLLKFNEDDFLERLKLVFLNFKNEEQRRLNKIIASINNEYSYSEIAQKRLKGLERAILTGFPLMVTLVMYKDNLEKLSLIAKEIYKIIDKSPLKRKFHVEFRLMYIKETEEQIRDKSLVRDYHKLVSEIEKIINNVSKQKHIFTLWNFPLCYFKKKYHLVLNDTVEDRQKRRLIRVSQSDQLENTKVRSWESFLKSNKECQRCKLESVCSGIEKEYLTKNNFPSLKAF